MAARRQPDKRTPDRAGNIAPPVSLTPRPRPDDPVHPVRLPVLPMGHVMGVDDVALIAALSWIPVAAVAVPGRGRYRPIRHPAQGDTIWQPLRSMLREAWLLDALMTPPRPFRCRKDSCPQARVRTRHLRPGLCPEVESQSCGHPGGASHPHPGSCDGSMRP